MSKTTKRRLATVDLETDPEEYNGEYLPFVVGFYDGYNFLNFWDKPGFPGSCVALFVAYLQEQERPYLVYAHNGGKFDFMFLLEHLEKGMHIQNGRIVKCYIEQHELRDSFSIIPVPLADFKGKHEKKKFESREAQTHYYLEKFNRRDRLKHKKEILEYLEDDCLSLYEGVKRFRGEFGDRLTIGGTSMKELQKLHAFERGGRTYDQAFRPFYFGGRNQCFKAGIIKGDYKIYDVNSMYPHVMREAQHPISVTYEYNVRITKRTTFACIEALNYGCLPVRTKSGLSFDQERGVFFASIHEIIAGEETGTLKILRVKHAIEHQKTGNFETFVDTFYRKRMIARENKEEMLVLFYKLILNSAYGKFAQNPENYHDYIITARSVPEGACPGMPKCDGGPDCFHWKLSTTNGKYFIWARASRTRVYFNVATSASITGAARALLLRGLASAVDPLYCDTDSIICRDLKADIDISKLGAWKPEGSGDRVAIAGKKLYVVYDGDDPIKQASKGAIVPASQILDIAGGGNFIHTTPVPHFKLDGSHAYVTRHLVSTAKPSAFGKRVSSPVRP